MRISSGQKFSLTLMVTALELVCIFAAGMFGYAGYALLLISSVFSYVLLSEDMYLYAFLSYIAVSVIGYFIVPDKTTAIVFAGLAGHYPLFRTLADKRVQSGLASFCIKMLYCNVILIAALCLSVFVLKISVPTELPLPKWAVICLAESVLVLMELVHRFCRWLYVEKIRSGIVPRN